MCLYISDRVRTVFSFTHRVCLFLPAQAAKRGILTPGRGRGAQARGRGSARGRGRGIRGRPRGAPTHSVVDHRPRALEISGFTEADRVDLLPHFAVSLTHTHTHCDLFIFFPTVLKSIETPKEHVNNIPECLREQEVYVLPPVLVCKRAWVFVSRQQFGEIEDCQMEDSSLGAIITFRTRAEAEQVDTLVTHRIMPF